MHEVAERQLAAAAAANPAAAAHVPRGCLLRRVSADPSSRRPGALEEALAAAGLRGDRLSVWGWELAGCGEGYAADPGDLLAAVASMAALESSVVGELPPGTSPTQAANLLAGYGLLGAAVSWEEAAAALPLLESEGWGAGSSSGASSDTGSGSSSGSSRSRDKQSLSGTGGSSSSSDKQPLSGTGDPGGDCSGGSGEGRPMLFTARQKRLSFAEIEVLGAHAAAQGEAEEGDGILPFS